MNNKLAISYSLQNVNLQEENLKLKKEIEELKNLNKKIDEDLQFYKSIFETHRNSVVYNLYEKYRKGERIWIDKIRCDRLDVLELDQDEDTIEWLKPVRCER